MTRKLTKAHRRILNTHRGDVAPVGNRIEDKDVAEARTNKHPEFLEETMFAEHGTKVLITNPAADVYLEQAHREAEARKRKQKEERDRWTQDNI